MDALATLSNQEEALNFHDSFLLLRALLIFLSFFESVSSDIAPSLRGWTELDVVDEFRASYEVFRLSVPNSILKRLTQDIILV